MSRPSMDLGDLVEHWTLVEPEFDLVARKHGVTKLGFALMVKFYGRFGRFPRGRGEFHADAVEFVARQLRCEPGNLGFYEWDGITYKRHRGEIRRFFGFRATTVADQDKLVDWLAGDVAQRERCPELVREQFLAECRARQLEPPTAGQVDRIVGTALRLAGDALAARIVARLDRDTALRLLTLVSVGDHDDSALLRSVKATTGDVSLKSMLTEIDKQEAVRSFRLPGDLFRDVAPKVVKEWRDLAMVESPSHMREHPVQLQQAMLAALLYCRQQEVTDALVTLLVSTVHRIGARANRRVTTKLVNEFKKVSGKENLLFRVAEAAVGRPDDTVRQGRLPGGRRGQPAVAGGRVQGIRADAQAHSADDLPGVLHQPLPAWLDPAAGGAGVPVGQLAPAGDRRSGPGAPVRRQDDADVLPGRGDRAAAPGPGR
ncbi:DUF4158 domain-containing protein [Catellatospora methionotrophica]|uniref:DUF4158 domain-containing protein n=1 Tax=Catellatospora methionotrophica TaxID=121620 RepID=UPI0033C9A59C